MSEEVLVVEPQEPARREIRRALVGRGYRVHDAGNGDAAVARMAVEIPAAVVLDIATPASRPRSTMTSIKRVSDIPVLLLAQREQQAESVRDLLGVVDDCLIGPAANEEVVWGLEAIIRRAVRYSPAARHHDDGWIAMDMLARTASVAGEPLELTSTEFTMLAALVGNAGSVMAPPRLAEIVWFLPGAASVCQVKLCISQVRAKIGPSPHGGSPIVTLPGYGYRYIPPVIDR